MDHEGLWLAAISTPTSELLALARLGALTLSSAGSVEVEGTTTATLGSVASESSVSVPVQASTASTLGSLALAAAGLVNAQGGVLAATLGEIVATSTGSVSVGGVSTAVLGATTGAASGSVAVDGSASNTLGAATLTAAGTVTDDIVGSTESTLGALTASAAGSVDVQGATSSTLGAMTASAAGYAEQVITVDPVRWSELPLDFELGTAGSTMRSALLTVGSSDYVWWSHAVDTPAGVVQTGPDPGDFEAAVAGDTGHEVELPAGNSTSAAHASLLATTLAGITGVTSARSDTADNDDGSRNVYVRSNLAIATGTRAWASRGAAGLHGGHGYRCAEAGEAGGTSQFTITRWLANRISQPNADDRIWAVQCMLGDTVSTAAADRPRLMCWASTSTTTPDGTEVLADFGQVPASQVVAGQAGTIFLTAAQCLSLRNAIDNATGTNLWLTIASESGNVSYSALSTGSGLEGEAVDQGVRVERSTGTADPTTAPTEWDNTGAGSGLAELNFPFLTGLRFCYDRDPCNTGEHRTVWGAFASYATYSSDVVLPDTITAYRAPVDGLERGRIRELRTGAVAGSIRYALYTGGTHTPDAPSMAGATVLWDAGQNVANGASAITAPTGADTVRVPTTGGMWVMFKGAGATGRGDAGPAPFLNTGRVDQPSSWIRRTDGGGLRGTTVSERDNANGAGYGDDTVAFEGTANVDPIVIGTETAPFNHSSSSTEIYHPAIAIAA